MDVEVKVSVKVHVDMNEIIKSLIEYLFEIDECEILHDLIEQYANRFYDDNDNEKLALMQTSAKDQICEEIGMMLDNLID